jgi:hypothetical protein
MDLKQTITIRPAFDKRNPKPHLNCGIHGCELICVIGNDNGYVQFVLYTNWLLPETEEEFKADPGSIMVKEFYPFTFLQAPLAADLGYHSPVPHYEGQTANDCHLLPGGKCYYDGSSLQATEMFNHLRREGTDGLWKRLAAYHAQLFQPTPVTVPNPPAKGSA